MERSCARCGATPRAEDLFCGRCGSPITRVREQTTARFCTRCGEALAEGARFCPSCGADALTSAGAPTERSIRLPEPTNGNGGLEEGLDAGLGDFDLDEEDLLAEWEDAVRTPVVRQRHETAPTETIVRPTEPARMASAPPPVMEEVTPPADVLAAPAEAPPADPLPAPAPHDRTSPEGPFRFPLGATLALLGALCVIVSAVLPWGRGQATLPRDFAVARLLEPSSSAQGVSLGVALLIAGIAGALVALLSMAAPGVRFLRRVVGFLSLLLPLAFALRLAQPLLERGEIASLWTALGAGVYLAAAGSFVQLVAGRWFRR